MYEGICLGLGSSNGRGHYIVSSSLIGCAQTHNDPDMLLETQWIKLSSQRRHVSVRRLTSPATSLFVQQFVQTNIKGTIKAPYYCQNPPMTNGSLANVNQCRKYFHDITSSWRGVNWREVLCKFQFDHYQICWLVFDLQVNSFLGFPWDSWVQRRSMAEKAMFERKLLSSALA